MPCSNIRRRTWGTGALGQAVRKDAEANTSDILNVVNVIENKPTPPQTQNGLKNRPEEIEEVRTQPAGMRASVDLIYPPLDRPDQRENIKDIEAKNYITHTHKGSHPEARVENDAPADQGTKIDTSNIDTDTNAIKGEFTYAKYRIWTRADHREWIKIADCFRIRPPGNEA